MAVGTYALTSLASLKAYLGVTTSTDDSIMESCIDRATAQIETYIGRNILARAWSEWHYAFSPNTIRLNHSPVSSLLGVFAGFEHALTITSTISADLAVTASINSEAIGSGTAGAEIPSLTLYRMSSLGNTASATLSFATYPNSTALVTAISAVSGFSATLARDMPTLHLHPTVADVKTSSFFVDGARTGVESSIDSATGLLRLRECASNSVLVRYTAGYAAIPADIEQACLALASQTFLARKADTSLVSESLGDYSYSRDQQSHNDQLASMLSNWREIR